MQPKRANQVRVLAEGLRWFRICGTCYALYEIGRPDGLNQQCRCSAQTADPWPRFDFNERARLCACCGMEVLASGSRWSPYFCRECQLLAMGVSLWERRLVIPIGRHSMMHTWVPATRGPHPAPTAVARADTAEAVYVAVRAIAGAGDRLHQWSALIVSRHLLHLGLPDGTPLSDYLDAIKETGTTRWGLFAELCEFLRAPADGPVEPEAGLRPM